MPPAERRRHLIEAAIELYGKRSYEQVSVDDITSAADVSRCALLYRFSPARRTFTGLHARRNRNVLEQLTAPFEGNPAAQLRHALGELLAYAEAHPSGGIVLLRHGLSDSTTETSEHFARARQQIIEFLYERGGIQHPTPMMAMTIGRGSTW